MRPRVLIGYSRCQLTRQGFERAGCEAWTCDLLPVPGEPNHIQWDIWDVLGWGCWDFAVLHPMCTYLTVSAAWAYADPDFRRYPDAGYHQRVAPGTLVGGERREARGEALAGFRRLLALPFPVALENPGRSFVSSAIRPADQLIQPYEFGDDASKLTGLWLSPGVPPLQPLPREEQAQPRWVAGRPRWGNQTDSGQNRLTPGAARWLERSATYPGIAEAMGAQWGAWLTAR